MEKWKIKYQITRCNGRKEKPKSKVFELCGNPRFEVNSIRIQLNFLPLYDKLEILDIKCA